MNRMLRTIIGLTWITASLTMTSVFAAPVPVYTFSGGAPQSGQQFTYGFSFTPTTNITVDSLGFFDFGIDGLAAGHQVGIWNSGGTLLASTTVTTAGSALLGPVVGGGQFRYTGIAALQLLSGVTYVFGAAEGASADVWYSSVTNISASSLVNISPTGLFVQGSFAFPSQSIGNSYAIGSFTATATSQLVPVPEPEIIALLGIGSLAAIGAARRRRRHAD